MVNHKELINSEQFNNALTEGANCKKENLTSFKTQNKQNYKQFEDIMFECNDKAKKILEIKKKDRSEEDSQYILNFKKDIRSMYSQTQDLCVNEHLEEGKKTKIEKIVDKIVPVIDILRYIDKNALDAAFNNRGIVIATGIRLEDKFPQLADNKKKNVIVDILNSAIKIKQQMLDNDEYINNDIFTTKVPIDLQYEKGSNNVGLKASDFKKLVDMKTQLIMAISDEAKEKAEDKIEHVASEKQFEIARSELVRDKLTKLQ